MSTKDDTRLAGPMALGRGLVPVTGWRARAKTTAALTCLALSVSCASAARVARRSMGDPALTRGRMVLIIQPGLAEPDRLRADLEPIVSKAVADGARLRAFSLNGGSAAAMKEIPFTDRAGGGDFYPSGRNDGAWEADGEAFEAAALAELDPYLYPDQTLDATGADLTGSLVVGLAKVRIMDGEGDLRVVLVTGGGGVHRTAQLDLVTAALTPANAAELALRVPPIDISPVAVDVIGVGRFEGIAVDPVFTAGVQAWWHLVCPECRFS